jgi:hypothetical protein
MSQENTKAFGARWRAAKRLLLDENVARNKADLSKEAAKRQPIRIGEKKDITIRISETTRTLAFGSLASCYALLFANKELAASFAGVKPLLLWSAIFGVLAVVVDGAQYLFAFINVQQALAADDQLFPRNFARRGRATCFILKQGLAYFAALLLVAAIALTFFASPQNAPAPCPKAVCPAPQVAPVERPPVLPTPEPSS